MRGTIVSLRIAAFAVAVAGATVASVGAAEAGGFGVREQSTSGLGAAFAGIAAGSDLSSMFWNPAALSVAREPQAQIDGSLILPETEISGTATLEPLPQLQPPLPPSLPLSFLDLNGGDFAGPAFIPALYAGTPLGGGLSVGFGFNGPFGVTTEPEHDNWSGKFEGRTSRLTTYNFNPVVSYALAPSLIVGAGAQLEYADAVLKSAFPGIGGLVGPNPSAVIEGDDLGFGYTLGLLWRPLPKTAIGLGFRSSVEHDLEGETAVAGVPTLGRAKVSVDLETPEIATVSLRQSAGSRLTLLGTIEWTNWSDLQQVALTSHTTNPALGATKGAVLATLPFHWHDGWFFSGGAEYALNGRAILRAGMALEESPIRNAAERLTRVPDSNRIWLSLGATLRLGAMTSMDIAYAHVFFADGRIDRETEIPGLGSVQLTAEAEQHLDILAISFKVRLGPVP
jgi:long-chain fatty acid transport protein